MVAKLKYVDPGLDQGSDQGKDEFKDQPRLINKDFFSRGSMVAKLRGYVRGCVRGCMRDFMS